MVLLPSADTAMFLATEMGKALLNFIMRADSEVDIQAPLAAVGLDSLVSLELRGWIRRWMGVDLATLEMTRCENLQVLGAVLQSKLVEKYKARA